MTSGRATVRPVLLLGLYLAAATGASAATGAAGSGTELPAIVPAVRDVAVGVFAVVGLAGLWTIFFLLRTARWRRRDDENPPHVIERHVTRRDQAIALAASVVLAAVTVAIALTLLGRQRPTPQHPAASTGVAPPSRPGSSASPSGASTVHHGATPTLFAAAGIALVVLLAVGYLIYRHLETSRRTERTFAAAMDERRFDEVIERAGAALDTGATPRAAIIACYRSMEHDLAGLGVGRPAADTPAELMARAIGAGLAGPPAARRLTELFREARFSDHPISAAQQQLAADALAELRTTLAGRR